MPRSKEQKPEQASSVQLPALAALSVNVVDDHETSQPPISTDDDPKFAGPESGNMKCAVTYYKVQKPTVTIYATAKKFGVHRAALKKAVECIDGAEKPKATPGRKPIFTQRDLDQIYTKEHGAGIVKHSPTDFNVDDRLAELAASASGAPVTLSDSSSRKYKKQIYPDWTKVGYNQNQAREIYPIWTCR